MSKLDIRLAQHDDRLQLVELQRRASLKWEDAPEQLLETPSSIPTSTLK